MSIYDEYIEWLSSKPQYLDICNCCKRELSDNKHYIKFNNPIHFYGDAIGGGAIGLMVTKGGNIRCLNSMNKPLYHLLINSDASLCKRIAKVINNGEYTIEVR